MGTVLFAWELGGGLGHVLPVAAVANALANQGHRVVAALRELPTAHSAFDPKVALLAAPCIPRPMPLPHPTRSFADVLARVGWGEDRALFTLAAGWRTLLNLVRPDLVLFDNAPTAMLASRGMAFRRALMGIPFSMPPDCSPFPRLWAGDDGRSAEGLRADEDRLLARANRVLGSWREEPLKRLGQLYSEVDQTFLTTLPELDPYARSRPLKTPYWGPPPPAPGGSAPHWPDGCGPKVFAYLKPFRALPDLLRLIVEKRLPTVLFIDGPSEPLRERFHGATLRFEPKRVDLAHVAAECDLAILHGGHGATCSLLLAGKPCLLLPLHLEQGLTARAVRRTGAGLDAAPADASLTAQKLQTLLSSSQYTTAAGRFAARYARLQPRRQHELLIRGIGDLLSPAPTVRKQLLHRIG